MKEFFLQMLDLVSSDISINTFIQLGILFVSIYALKQIKVSKEISETTNERNSIKYASSLTKYFLEEIIPQMNKIQVPPEFSISKLGKGNKFLNIKNFEESHLAKDSPDIHQHLIEFTKNYSSKTHEELILQIVSLLNTLESFAFPFTNNVADEEASFFACGQTFCSTIEEYYFLISLSYDITLTKHMPYYPNIQKLYKLWMNRMSTIHRNDEILSLEERIKKIQQEISIKSLQ